MKLYHIAKIHTCVITQASGSKLVAFQLIMFMMHANQRLIFQWRQMHCTCICYSTNMYKELTLRLRSTTDHPIIHANWSLTERDKKKVKQIKTNFLPEISIWWKCGNTFGVGKLNNKIIIFTSSTTGIVLTPTLLKVLWSHLSYVGVALCTTFFVLEVGRKRITNEETIRLINPYNKILCISISCFTILNEQHRNNGSILIF